SRVVIAGGGQLGMQLARRLEKVSGFSVTLLEADEARADYCSEELDRALILHGSSLDQEIMRELGINGQTAFVAVTGDDENNIMSCLVADKLGAHFTISRVDKNTYQSIIDSLSLVDRVISPHSSLINSIYHFVRGNSVMGDRMLQKIPGEVVDVVLEGEHPWLGKQLIDIDLPRSCMISMVLRGKELRVATGDLELISGDRILLYGLPKSIRKLENVLS
ncbi:MAG: NAD-binding protein, partial [Kiritimatiellae bacterium]|nr:NAD-binding protein [Kiritimatiellia bacterium]